MIPFTLSAERTASAVLQRPGALPRLLDVAAKSADVEEFSERADVIAGRREPAGGRQPGRDAAHAAAGAGNPCCPCSCLSMRAAVHHHQRGCLALLAAQILSCDNLQCYCLARLP